MQTLPLMSFKPFDFKCINADFSLNFKGIKTYAKLEEGKTELKLCNMLVGRRMYD